MTYAGMSCLVFLIIANWVLFGVDRASTVAVVGLIGILVGRLLSQ